MDERFITVPLERYEELLIAERDANLLKRYIHEAAGDYLGINDTALKTLDKLYFGKVDY